jgi:predicted regulator of Ras-like GTPase activity (Roadblock/LC7/MglB family)
MVKQKRNIQETTSEPEPLAVESASCESAQSILEEIRKLEGVNGYILRNTYSATVNLNDPSMVTEYAILSYSTFEASEKIKELFDLGEIDCIIIEGKDKKTLQLTLEENYVSIFLEKNVDETRILEKLRPS